MEAAVGPVTELIKCSIPFLKRQIDYMVHCKRKFNQLKEKVAELEQTRNDVQLKVDTARRNVESIRQAVEAWLVKVASETTRDGDDQTILRLVMNGEAVNMISTKCWCSCGSGSRYNLARKAQKKMLVLHHLLIEGKSFGDNVSNPRVMDINPMSINNQDDFESFASRDHVRDEIMAALQDPEINIIGVYGMGGVGKTTLVIAQVYDQVKEKNLFDEVVMITVSQNVDTMKKIQNDLADMLGLNQMKEADTPLKRANLLLERLKQKNTLLILDDLWTSDLSLFQLGIPCGGNHDKVCKVIITTRRLEVCTMLGSQKVINVRVLSEQDSWKLFRKNVGDIADSNDELGLTARNIAKECGGLPVALVTLVRGLRFKEKHVWDDTLRELRNSETTSIEGMEPKVFTSVKVSYDFLDRDIYKKCFLLCCLFPEDHHIELSDLMAYVVGDDTMLVDDYVTMKQMTDKIKTVLDKLVDSCLLLRKDLDDDRYVVSMHDVIRDVAINIASHHQEGNWFLVRAGSGLERWPTNSLLTSSNGTSKCLRRISLMNNEITELPTKPPELPHLLSLSLCANYSLEEIPDSFFQRMGSLATLDLSKTGISSLPSSLSFLLNLKILCVDRCFNQSSNISVIGKLKKLEVLKLSYCGLHGLPEEIGELTNLRLLDLESRLYNVFDYTIPRNVISSLSRLEYLNMWNCKIKWGVEGLENVNNACYLEEVASLHSLSGLVLGSEEYLYNNVITSEADDISTDNPSPGYVTDFYICFPDASRMLSTTKRDWDDKSLCKVNVSPPVGDSVMQLIQRVETLILDRCTGLKNVGQVLGNGFNNLRELDVRACKEMEYLMIVAETDFPGSLAALERLSCLRIHSCPRMVTVFDHNLGRRVPNLESFIISTCDGLKDVFNLEEIEKSTFNTEEGLSEYTFSRLRKMSLDDLPVLETVWKGCIPFQCFESLEQMVVDSCPKLRYLFTTSMAKNLQNLEQLRIQCCSGMVKLITLDVEMVCDANNQHLLKIFPNLKILIIGDCENLNQLWDGKNVVKEDEDQPQAGRASVLDLPYLEHLEVVGCKNLKRIYLTHQCTQQLKFIGGDSEEWFHQGLEWENPNDKLHMQHAWQLKLFAGPAYQIHHICDNDEGDTGGSGLGAALETNKIGGNSEISASKSEAGDSLRKRLVDLDSRWKRFLQEPSSMIMRSVEDNKEKGKSDDEDQDSLDNEDSVRVDHWPKPVLFVVAAVFLSFWIFVVGVIVTSLLAQLWL